MVGFVTSLALTNVIYGQRNDPAASTSLGSEEEVSSVGGYEKTYEYSCDWERKMVAGAIV